MPVKFPMSGRYTNYHPLALHASNLHSPSQNCSNETDDCNANQMQCRTFVYHPAAVFIPHTHAPSYTTSGTTSLLPTPPPSTQQTFDYNSKQNFRDYSKGIVMNPQNNYGSQNPNYLMPGIHQNNFSKPQSSGNPQLYKYNPDAMHKYQSLSIHPTRLSGHHYKRNFNSNVGSSSCFLSQKFSANNSVQNAHKPVAQTYSSVSSNSKFEYNNGRKYNEHHSDNTNSKLNHTSGRKNSSYRVTNSTNADFESLKNGQTNDSSINSNRVNSQSNTNVQSGNSTETGTTDKPTSPPPAPYSPMTRPLPTLSPPTSQVQFYTPAPNRFQQPPPMSHQQQQQQSNQRRYAAPPPLRRPNEKYSSAASQNSVLRPSKYKVNGIIQTGSKVSEDSIGGAGDATSAVGRMPITPPSTPRNHSSEPNQLSDACHQMQALNL